MHLLQLGLENRFQKYEQEFWLNDLLGIQGKEIKVERITEPPIKYLFIKDDHVCPPEKQIKYVDNIPATYSVDTIEGRDHAYVVGDNDDEFVNLLMASLSHAPNQLSSSDCSDLLK